MCLYVYLCGCMCIFLVYVPSTLGANLCATHVFVHVLLALDFVSQSMSMFSYLRLVCVCISVPHCAPDAALGVDFVEC